MTLSDTNKSCDYILFNTAVDLILELKKYCCGLIVLNRYTIGFFLKLKMASHLSTKDRLLSLIDDIELIAKYVLKTIFKVGITFMIYMLIIYISEKL